MDVFEFDYFTEKFMDKKYEIKVVSYNHVSGHDAEVIDELYTDLNTAKREMLKLLFEDDILTEEGAMISIRKDLMIATVTSRFDDYTDYIVREAEDVLINETVSDKVTLDEFNEMVAKVRKDNDALAVEFVEFEGILPTV